MIVFAVNYLLNRSLATVPLDYDRAEWPPHPDRLFMALVDALHVCNLGKAERSALLWLEKQPPPIILYPEAFQRKTLPCFVPVNDVTLPARPSNITADNVNAALDLLPAHPRGRKERLFPAVALAHTQVFFAWNQADGQAAALHLPALNRLAKAIVYLGHPSSLVAVSVLPYLPRIKETGYRTIKPAPGGDITLRVTCQGRLENIEQSYHIASQPGKARLFRPPPGRPCSYKTTEPAEWPRSCASVFSSDWQDWFVFQRCNGPRLPLIASLNLTSRLREALLKHAPQPPLPVISGHQRNSEKLDKPHVAFLPLPNVGHRYSDGTIMGLAITLPRNITHEERLHVLQAIQHLDSEGISLALGQGIKWELRKADSSDLRSWKSLMPQRFTQPGLAWATVTPVVLGHFPARLLSDETKEILASSCRIVGLPSPSEIRISTTSPIPGVPPSTCFPSLSVAGKPVKLRFTNGRYVTQKHDAQGRPARLRLHAWLAFDKPVQGPLLIGAGRYYGLGLCIPWTEKPEAMT